MSKGLENLLVIVFTDGWVLMAVAAAILINAAISKPI
jgi:hypothetical protein